MPDAKVFIYRKGNGGAHVHPSPQTVKPKQVVRFWNTSGCKAEVKFKASGVADPDAFTIEDGRYVDATIVLNPSTPQYKEYKVKLSCTGLAFGHDEQYAEGGSDPGMIIDP